MISTTAVSRSVLVARDPDGRICGLDVALGKTVIHVYDARDASPTVHLFLVGGEIAVDNPGDDDMRILTADCELIVRVRR